MIAFFVVSMATEKDSDCLTICKLSWLSSSPPKAAEAAQMLQQAREHRLGCWCWGGLRHSGRETHTLVQQGLYQLLMLSEHPGLLPWAFRMGLRLCLASLSPSSLFLAHPSPRKRLIMMSKGVVEHPNIQPDVCVFGCCLNKKMFMMEHELERQFMGNWE